MLLSLLFFINHILAKKTKIFCRYNHQGLSKVFDPAYENDKGDIVYAQTIEEYAKVLGPTWYGVSWCDNSTMVNSIGLYFDISKVQKILKEKGKDDRHDKTEKKYVKREDENTMKNNYLRDKSSIEEYKENVNKYVDKIYDHLKNSNKQCIPLVSVNPAFNPYHKSLIVGITGSPNIRDATGISINFLNSDVESVIDYNNFDIHNDFTKNIAKCAGVNNCEGCNVICNTLISTTIENQYSITTSDGTSVTHSIGDVTSDSNTLTDEISNTIEVAKSLSKSNSISESDSESGTNTLEVAIAIAQSESNSVSNETSATHNEEYSESNIHSISEEDSHAITNTEGETNEVNWNVYKEHSGTTERNQMLQSDYDYYNDQYEEVKRIDYVGKDSKYENKSNNGNSNNNNNNKKKNKRGFRFKRTDPVKYTNNKRIERETFYKAKSISTSTREQTENVQLEKRILPALVPALMTGGEILGKVVPKIAPKLTKAVSNSKVGKFFGKIFGKGDDKGNSSGKGNGNGKGTFEKITGSVDTYYNGRQADAADEANKIATTANDIARQQMLTEHEDAEKTFNQTELWNQKNYDQTEVWNQKNYDQTEYWNNMNYDQTEKWNNLNYDQTEKWNNKNYDQT